MIELALRVVVFLAAAAIPVVCALLAVTEARRDHVRTVLAMAMAGATIGYNLYYFMPAVFRPELSLPLQVCDLLGVAAVLALATRWRFFRAIIMLSTLPFVSQAVLTPVGDQSAASLRTVLYWSFHALIFATFLFELAVDRFRTVFGDLKRLFVVDVGYVILIGALDAGTGWNYGYIGDNRPDAATLVDVLGPWPLRILFMLTLAMLLQTACHFVFQDRGRADDFRG